MAPSNCSSAALLRFSVPTQAQSSRFPTKAFSGDPQGCQCHPQVWGKGPGKCAVPLYPNKNPMGGFHWPSSPPSKVFGVGNRKCLTSTPSWVGSQESRAAWILISRAFPHPNRWGYHHQHGATSILSGLWGTFQLCRQFEPSPGILLQILSWGTFQREQNYNMLTMLYNWFTFVPRSKEEGKFRPTFPTLSNLRLFPVASSLFAS